MKVNGIGGVFLYADDPVSLAAWYSERLGMELIREGAGYTQVFTYQDPDEPAKRLETTFAILPARERLGNRLGEFMINYRVDDLEALAARLVAAGVAVEEIQTLHDGQGLGRFAHLADPEGNRVELYQPLR